MGKDLKQTVSLEKAVSAVLAFIVGVVPVIIVPSLGDPVNAPKMVLIQVLVFSLFLCYAKPFLEFFKTKPFIPLPVKIVLLYLLCITITLPFSTDIMRSLEGHSSRFESYSSIVFYGILMMLGAFFYRFQKWHLWLYTVGVSFIGVYGILQKFGVDFLPNNPSLFGAGGSSYSTIGNPNFLGSFLTLALPVMAYAFVKDKKIYLFPCVVVYFCLLCTNTRGSWIGSFCAMVILGVFLLKEKENHKRLLVLGVSFMVMTALYFVVTSGFIDRFLSVFRDLSEILSRGDKVQQGGSYRIFIWSKVTELIKMRPLTGFGIENLDTAMKQYFGQDIINIFGYSINVDKAHNEYLHIAVCSGIFAAVAYFAFEISVVAKGFLRKVRKNPLTLPLLCSIIGYIIAACFNISVVSVAPVFWIFCGILTKIETE